MSTRTSALDALIFGVDVQSGDVRGAAPAYALVVFDGEEFDRDVVSLRKLRRLIDDERPNIVATDNVYELAPDKQGLIHLLGELPDETKLVQVTGAERPEPLSRVASRHDVPYGKDPMQEAEAAARLAARNVGHEVSAFTDTTQVKVSRGRSTGKGGWSEDRFTRRIHGAVRSRSRKVESALDDAGLTYEKDVTEKYGGYANATFAVEARPQDIPVSRVRAGDVRVEIERERRDGIEFRPLVKRRDYVLVGIDPGTTTAVALVDLNGSVLDVFSTRTADTAGVIEWIIERGRPVVVAADVTPMPETVEKIRRSFDADGWVPTTDLPVDEKLHRAREHGYDNDHQRDALAAALFAYDAHEDQFGRIASKVPPQIGVEEVIARVVSDGETVEAVLADLTEGNEQREEDTESGHEPAEPSAEQQTISRLRSRIDRLEGHVGSLKETIASKDETIDGLEGELTDARREERQQARERREINRLARENNRLERELDGQREETAALADKLERLKELWKIDHSNLADVAEGRDLVSVKPLEKFTRGAIRDAKADFGIARGDVVLLRDASGAGASTAKLLADLEPRVVLKHGGLSDAADEILFQRGIPVGPADGVAIQEIDELAVAKESDVEAAIADWEIRAEERRRQENAKMVDRLISEHRADRGKGESD